MNIVVLNNQEEFLQFLDPELCKLVETHEKGGLRTLSLDYKFQDLHEDKQLFKIGNKVWVSGDVNLTDCLYVINTPVEIDVYKENRFTMELEEVMVELNYAPIFSQTDLISDNGFKLTTTNGEQSVTINWNALNYWFGDYYNIGVVQKCLNENYNRVALSGTMTLMSLLRYIEEETGNIFVARYEKDPLTNVIHRYLDFLNPIDSGKDWELNLEYDFVQGVTDSGVYDSNDDPSTDEDEYADTESTDDLVDFTPTGTAWTDINPTNVEFRITDKDYNLLDADGLIYTEESSADPLLWDSTDIGFSDSLDYVVITLSSISNVVGLICNEKSFVVPASEECGVPYGNGYLDLEEIDDPTVTYTCSVPDDSYFTIYDTSNERTVFSTCINREIGHTHEEVLDIGFNLDNVIFETDESDTFTAIAPILTLDDMDGLNKSDMTKIINYWKNMSIEKGTTCPMIIEKIMVQASSLSAAQTSLGTYNLGSNYYTRPYHPNDNIDTTTASNSEWEFWRATAYWKAPFTKNSGEMFVSLDQDGGIEYTSINPRPDWREERTIRRPKIGSVETTNEVMRGIYNEVCLKLKDKMTPAFNITVDVANLRNKRFNDYQLHDKVYVKLPDYQELVTARVSKTVKEAHDVAKNTIELDNYSINAIKNVQCHTYIDASNTSFKYPNTKDLTVRLINEDYDSSDPYSVEYPANKLISFVLYKKDGETSTLTKTSYTKLTNAYGYATINMAYDPGDYELEIRFGGDEEYEETSIIVEINVSGTKEVPKATVTTSKSKPVKKTSTKKSKTTKKVTNKSKKVTSTKTRTSAYTQPSDLKKKALSIVGDSTGLDAAKKIAKWCGTKRNFKYASYANFHRKAATAYKFKSANCCDSTRLMLSMMDAAGCSTKLKLQYVHCHNSAAGKGHVFAKITTRSSGKYRYVDPCCKLENGRSPWGNHLRGYGPIVAVTDYTGPNSSPF